MDFNIDEQFLRDICYKKTYHPYLDSINPNSKDLMDFLKGKELVTLTRYEDHPTFTQFRTELNDKGFIKIEKSWLNGDIVLEPFTLNGVKFKKGDKFPSAAAIRFYLENKRKNASVV